MNRLVIGTRGSPLAMWQAEHVQALLRARHPGLAVELKVIHTRGDKVLDASMGGPLDRGLFTREIQVALLEGEVDLAVHSLKDLPTESVDGLTLGAVTKREDPADALVAKTAHSIEQLPRGAKVFTGSLRRKAQLLHRRGDLEVLPIRGNVGTRLQKLQDSPAEAILLACAGLKRLRHAGAIRQRLAPEDFLPACGQGALAVEIRRKDRTAGELIAPLDDPACRAGTTAERSFLAALGGGCQIPAGAYAALSGDGRTLKITAMVADLDGKRLLRRSASAPMDGPGAAPALGRGVAEEILAAGGREILQSLRGAAPGGEDNA